MDTRVTEGSDELRYHGGNINAARRLFPDAPEPWIDLSTGINQVPYPVGAIAPSVWTRLPETAEVEALETAAHAAYQATACAEIVAAPGSQALIQRLPRLLPARRVGILGFTYPEHERCWRDAGAEVTTVSTISELPSFDVGVVVNPNNPDGRTLPPDLLAATARTFAEQGGLLVVDEAFMDALPATMSLTSKFPEAGAVILRSFGKIYGLAGLRLGFAAAAPDLAVRLRAAVGPWAVSGPAIEIGRRALADKAWLAKTIARLSCETERLDAVLRAAGFSIAGGAPLFRLAQRADAAVWFEKLGRAGILTRPFQTRSEWLRFGVPHGGEQWRRLETALLGS